MADKSMMMSVNGPRHVGVEERFAEIVQRLGVELNVVFDCGANVGQTITGIRALAPHGDVFSFEPVTATFERLRENWGHDPACHLFHAAVGEKPGTAYVTAAPLSEANSLVDSDGRPNRPSNKVEPVQVVAGDDIVATHGIEQIDYLKLDVEGYELPALRGFLDTLRHRRVHMIQLEVGFSGRRRMRTSFAAAAETLGYFDYHVYRIYDQHGRPLEFANAMFVRDS